MSTLPSSLVLITCLLWSLSAGGAGDAVPPPPGRLVDIGGWKLHLNCTGRRRGAEPVVVFESGAGSTSFDWYFVQRSVSSFARACSYDRAGTAWSDVGPHPRTIRQMEYELHELLARAGIRPPYVLVGHSFGGLMVRVFQRSYPTDVAGLVLVDGTSDDTRLVHFDKLVHMRELSSGRPIPPIRTTIDDSDRVETPAGAFTGAPVAAARVPAPTGTRPAAEPLSERPEPAWPPDVQRLRDWASTRREIGAEPGDGDYTGQEFEELYQARHNTEHVLADLPLVVLIARLRQEPVGLPPEWFVSNDEINRQEEELASMSTVGRYIYARHSPHAIQLHEPDVVTEAIQSVLKATRSRS